MNTTEAILTRRSVRKYDPTRPVTREQLHTMLDAAMHAPSARNSRPWEFIVLTDPEKIRAAKSYVLGSQCDTATALIVVVAVPDRQVNYCEGNHLNDCGAATATLLLQAWELGIATCWCGLYPVQERMDAARKALGLPDHVIPFCSIPMGFPAETPDAKGFYDESLVHYDRW